MYEELNIDEKVVTLFKEKELQLKDIFSEIDRKEEENGRGIRGKWQNNEINFSEIEC